MNKYGAVRHDSQELTGLVAPATNTALALGRNVVGQTFAQYGTVQAGWSDGGGEIAVCDGSQEAESFLAQTYVANWSQGITWQTTLKIQNYSAGNVRLRLGAVSLGTNRSANGTYVENIAGGIGNSFGILADANFVGEIDLNVMACQQTNIAASASFADPANNPLSGTHTGVVLGANGNSRIPVMITDDGSTSYTDVKSAEFNSMLDPTDFALSMFIQKGTWDAAERYSLSYTVDASNWIRMGGTSTAGQLVWEVRAGGTPEQVLLATGSPTAILHIGIQVTGGAMKAIYNGAVIGTETVAGTFVGNFATMVHGAKNDTPNNVHLGKRAFNIQLSSGLSDSEWLNIARAGGVI